LSPYIFEDYIKEDMLQEYQDAFAHTTGLATVVIDYCGEAITKCSNFSEFCKLVMLDDTYCNSCCQEHAYGGLEAARRGRAYYYKCHAGLVNIAVPIIIDKQYYGAIMAGHVRLSNNETDKAEYIIKSSERLLENKKISDAYESLPVIQFSKVMAAGQLLQELVDMVVEYLTQKDTIKNQKKELQDIQQKLQREIKAKHGLEQELKDAYKKILQAQFSDHFLYNTLNTIGSLAVIENAHRTHGLVYLLGDLLRYSTKNGWAGTVEIEKGQIERYFKLYSTRFGNRFSYELAISPKILKCPIPLGILQPFVENSIVHGLEPKESDGFIRLSGYKAEDGIGFDIVDNGIGMSKERLNEVMKAEDSFPLSTKSDGIGIKNVYQRLAYTYGNRFKLNIKSKLGKGTSVCIKLPKTMAVR